MFEKGHPKYGGRPKGQGNKIAGDIRTLCQRAGPEIVNELLRLVRCGRHEMTRIAAAKELLDRGFGKAKQTIEGEMVFGVSAELQRLLSQCDGNSRSVPLREIDAEDVGQTALPTPTISNTSEVKASLPAPNGGKGNGHDVCG